MILEGDDRAQAEELLATYRRRLRIRERQIAHYGESVEPSVVMDADDARRHVDALEELLAPPLDDAVIGLVRRRLADDVLLFVQGVQMNARVSIAEKVVAETKTAVEKIQGEIGRINTGLYEGSQWRLDKGPLIDTLVARATVDDTEAVHGRKRNLWIQLFNAVLLVIILVTVAWLISRVSGR